MVTAAKKLFPPFSPPTPLLDLSRLYAHTEKTDRGVVDRVLVDNVLALRIFLIDSAPATV